MIQEVERTEAVDPVELLKAVRLDRQACIESLTQGDDGEALGLLPKVVCSGERIERAWPEHRQELAREESESLLQVLAGIASRVQSERPEVAQRAVMADFCCHVTPIMRRLQHLGENLPRWVAVIEEQLTQEGAMRWMDRLRQEPSSAPLARGWAIEFLIRLAELQDPPAEWVLIHAKDLLSEEAFAFKADGDGPGGDLGRVLDQLLGWGARLGGLDPLPQAVQEKLGLLATLKPPSSAAKTPLPEPEFLQPAAEPVPHPRTALELEARIRDDVFHWLEHDPHGNSKAELGLAYVPGARVVPHDPFRLKLNLAPLLALRPTTEQLDRLISAFFKPLQAAGRGSRLQLREPVSSLYESLGYLWRQGQELDLAQFAPLNTGVAAWNRCGGPAVMGARLLQSEHTARFERGRSLLRPEAVELAALQSLLYESDHLDGALAALRRNHHNLQWMHATAGPAPERNLKRLHTEAGFYANNFTPMDCLQRWGRGTLGALLQGEVMHSENTMLFLPVAQRLFEQTGLVQELVQWPG
ncbi:MAG: hypothetical protein WBM08_13235, partial [Prochlorococcaceae cyanobacterium]